MPRVASTARTKKPKVRTPFLPTGKPNPVDIHVGSRVRMRRTLMGLSQEKLGEAIGLTFQQVQKYERGANRIGSSRLYQLSRVLDVPVAFFFEELPPEVTGRKSRGAKAVAESPGPAYRSDPLTKRETLELVRAYYRIGDTDIRTRIFDMVKAIATALE